MEWVETTGETVDAAKDLALDQLGVDEQEAEFDVMEDAEVGWFGRMKSPARVRARIRPRAPRPKVDGRDRRKSSGGGSRGGRGRGGGKGRGGGSRGGGSGDGGSRGGGNAKQDRSGESEKASARGNDGKSEGKQQAKQERTKRPAASASTRPEKTEKPMTDLTIEEQATAATTFLEELASSFGLTASASWEEIEDDVIEVQLEGEQLGSLIGPEGRTLFAVQELARTALQRAAGNVRTARLRLDIGGYREKRQVALERFVKQVAERVREENIEQALEPMGSADRKIVHDTVGELDGVETISEGEEPRRRVVIVPA